MPVGKYYCDYCDKQFQDNPSARRRHLQGIQHQRNKALWYDSLHRPPAPDLQLFQSDSFGKGVCNHFVRSGFCQYGNACKYFHPKPNLQNRPHSIAGFTSAETVKPPFVLGTQLMGSAPFLGDVARDSSQMSLGNLPPSLRPPPEGGYPHIPYVDWG